MGDTGQALAVLRGRAEAWLAGHRRSGKPGSDDPARMLQEVELYQVELEMQNVELREARNEIEVGLQRYTELFDFAPVGYLEIETSSLIRQANREAVRLLGVDSGRLCGRLLMGLVDPDHQATVIRFLVDVQKPVAGTPNRTCEVRLRRTESDLIDVRISGVVMPGAGRRLLVALHDSTDRNRAEASAAAAKFASAAKTQFLSSMSHELRTPLNAILGFAQLLKQDRLEPLSIRHSERVDRILNGGAHLLRLINEILDLARIESGGVSLSIEPLAVGDVLEDVRTTLGPLAARQGVTLTVDPTAAAVPLIDADRTRLFQILVNFASNAIKYNRPAGSVALGVNADQPDFLRLTVRDTGVGIAADKQDKLFQPFQRAGQEIGPIEGTGLGLVITQRLARMIGGEVGFESVPGTGSTFWVDIPLHVRGDLVASVTISGEYSPVDVSDTASTRAS
jgi:signal transduction histidine kinase